MMMVATSILYWLGFALMLALALAFVVGLVWLIGLLMSDIDGDGHR